MIEMNELSSKIDRRSSVTNEETDSTRAARYPAIASSGVPSRKKKINSVDVFATSLCLLCLLAAIIIVIPLMTYSAQLGYNKQIIAIGFLLGVMNQCMLRTVPQTFILLEVQYGPSTLQNLDGILRWSPLANNLSLWWRALVVTFLLLPLGLSVGYKRYTGGVGALRPTLVQATLGPCAPPGTLNVGFTSTMANATLPFIASTTDDTPLPDFSIKGQVYGYNLVLFSETMAAALDIPFADNVSDIQQALGPNEVVILSADVRATVAQHSPFTATERADEGFWADPFKYGNFKPISLNNGYVFAWLGLDNAAGNAPQWFNSTWVFLGTWKTDDNVTHDEPSFRQSAQRFMISRHSCHATWNVTSGSIILASATCGDALPDQYQYYENCQLNIGLTVPPVLSEYLGGFATARNQSHWLMSTSTMSVAATYQSRVASDLTRVPVQVNGPVMLWWEEHQTGDFPLDPVTYNFRERYNGTLTKTLHREVMQAEWTLYLILAAQPLLTTVAFVAICLLHTVPVGRGLGLVSVLAGVERDSLDVLAGATLSGETKKAVRMEVRVVDEVDHLRGRLIKRLQYILGSQVKGHEMLDPKVVYH